MKALLGGIDAIADLDGGRATTPVRPALPWLLLPFFALWVGLALTCALCGSPAQYTQSVPFQVRAALFTASAIAVVALLYFFRRKQRCVVLALATVLLCAIGAQIGTQYWPAVISNGYELQAAQDTPLKVLVISDTSTSALSTFSQVKITLADGKVVTARVYWQSNQEPLLNGQTAYAHVSAQPLAEKNAYLATGGISATATLTNIQDAHFADDVLGSISARRASNSQLIAQVQTPGSALVQGMVLGDSRALDNTETARNFKITGLAHLIAVSGSHLAVIAVMLAWALERTSARRWFKTLLLVAFLAVYVVLTGFQPSAIRAAIMASVGALSFAAKRRRHTPSLLCAAALAMLVIDPANTFDVGYWLSVFAVLGISLFYPLARSLLSIKKWFYDNYVAQPAALTIVAQAATLPLSAAFFGMLSLVSPLANLLAAPFATIIVGGGIFALMLNQFYDPLAMLLIQAVCAVADAMIMLVNWLASLPVVATPFFMELPLAIGVAVFAGATIYIFWRRISKKVCTTMLAIVLVFALVGAAWAQNAIAPKLIMLSIGQGDAILVRDGPSTVLVDTGPSDTALLKALARQGVKRLDAVVLTHLDDDHAGALDALYGVVDTDTVYIADGLLDSTRASPMRQEAQKLTGEPDALTLARGDMLNISSALSAQVVWPQAPALEGANEESICLLLRYDCNGDGVPEFQSLLMGDAEQEELAQILASEQIGEVAVFKVGHHGSTDAVRASQLVQLNSKIALISAGENNRFGHPTAATLNELAQAQVEVFRTDQSGDITVSFTPTAIDVSYTGQ